MVIRILAAISCAWLWACAGVTPSAALVVNASRVTQCAEEDNVYVKLSGDGLRGMRIEARQPSYIAQLQVDDSKADFTDCHFKDSENPVYHFEPKRVVLWEDEHYLMIGNTYASYWRPDQVDVVIEGKVTHGIHLIQLHLKDKSEPKQGAYEFLVLYPPDGYWRAKPIPSLPMTASTYGTSFLVGPIKEGARPVVELAKVEFVPSEMTFRIDYEDGSHGAMHLLEIDRQRLALEYEHDRPQPASQPLAAIRSMFVTPERADTAEVSWRASPAGKLTTEGLSTFQRAAAYDVAFGRSAVSRHNPSAPDMWFGAFLCRGAAR